VSKSSWHGNMEESQDLSCPLQLGVEITLVFSQCLPCLLFLVTLSPSFWLTQLFQKIKTELCTQPHTALGSNVLNISREKEETENFRAHIHLELGPILVSDFQCFPNASHTWCS
jgi:hypothetical protein